MKKVFLVISLAFLAICVNAQTTWNVRGGLSVNTYKLGVAIEFVGQVNIPFKEAGRFTFSESLHAYVPCIYFSGIQANSYVGYRCLIKRQTLFYPKIGLGLGYVDIRKGDGFIMGPSLELAFEIKHFVVAANFTYPVIFVGEYDDDYHYDDIPNSIPVSVSFGYKF